ncbi:hypothetical protein ES707_14231 [subsurface metagenome]
MAIISRRNFKTELGAADLTLTALPGTSLLVKDVKIYSAAIIYANFLIGKASVGYYRVGDVLGNHLHFHAGRAAHSHDFNFGTVDAALSGAGAFMENAGEVDTALSIDAAVADTNYARVPQMTHTPSSYKETLLSYLWNKGIFKGFPVAEGETFTVDLITGANDVKVVEYDIYDAADMTNLMENGSKSEAYMFVSYGDSGGNIQAVADNILGQSNNPAEYPDFPFAAGVPSGHQIELLGLLASDVAPAANVAGTATYTDYLRMMRGRKVLFDEDHNGLLYFAPFADALGAVDMIAEGYAVGGNFTQCDLKQPLMFDPPIIFDEGETLTCSWHVVIAGAGAIISQALQEVAFILRLSKIA